MPIYEFKCMNCGKTFTVKMTVMEMEKSKITCPKCGSENVKKVISQFSTITSKKS
ncbi:MULTISPECIES: FmdB family zinc ribbon protein [Thermodesulfovibrio]|jgi:putative FmdB family regulatory protein|uniref:Regulatory protein n=1 Tax=Thermodesulfovibrio yellowstonii TaxID=28262 RepID=A0A9W6GHS3_9BACT|nr:MULTISPECIES: zinc ribbon domain-containing protein [Thermodesulfovibrio]MDI6865967.1 zinc ribbon domain-containing protein [Thermodesulfovibrio yellowstonii]GLI54262.1 regulatory protein [Thermodesulfovibrio islandicus]